MLHAILFWGAVVCEAAATIGWPKTNVNLMALGLALFFLSTAF